MPYCAGDGGVADAGADADADGIASEAWLRKTFMYKDMLDLGRHTRGIVRFRYFE